jgi:hypothetical protein
MAKERARKRLAPGGRVVGHFAHAHSFHTQEQKLIGASVRSTVSRSVIISPGRKTGDPS